MFARAAVLVASLMAAPAVAEVLPWESLDGWATDDHAAALDVFRQTCDLINAEKWGPDWGPVCAYAAEVPDDQARTFFELFFRPVLIGTPPALFTGYYEPVLDGSPERTGPYQHPVHARPPDLGDAPYLTRAQIANGALNGRGLELMWLSDPVELYFMQVQGSGRVRMPDGSVVRLGFDGKNNQPYRSIGQELVRRGTHRLEDVSASEIKSWVRANPQAGRELLALNPSYVFFRVIGRLKPDEGPIGAMGRSITAGRSLAADPAYVPLGAPVWVEKDGGDPIRRLFVAQDTGGAIKGAQRADIYFGTGAEAGEAAGRLKDPGRMVVLLPIEAAFAQAAP
jgi:membrane-bound lytic murein transglycosylase A